MNKKMNFSNKLFTIDENSEGYKNAIKNIKIKETIDNSIIYHSTQVFPKLPYTMELVVFIKFKNDFITEVIDEMNRLYLLLFEKDKVYAVLNGENKGLYSMLLIENKVVYFIDELYTCNADIEIIDGHFYHSNIPSYVNVEYLSDLKSINKNYLIDDIQLFFDCGEPYTFNINKIINKDMNHNEIFINKNAYDSFLAYWDNGDIFNFKESIGKFKARLYFNHDYHIKFNDNIIYFEKDKYYLFEINMGKNISFTLHGFDYNLSGYYDSIKSITTEARYHIDDISVPNIIKNISTLDINILKEKVIQHYGDIRDDIIIIYDQISSISIIDICNKSKNNIYQLLYRLNYDIKFLSIINGNVLNQL